MADPLHELVTDPLHGGCITDPLHEGGVEERVALRARRRGLERASQQRFSGSQFRFIYASAVTPHAIPQQRLVSRRNQERHPHLRLIPRFPYGPR